MLIRFFILFLCLISTSTYSQDEYYYDEYGYEGYDEYGYEGYDEYGYDEYDEYGYDGYDEYDYEDEESEEIPIVIPVSVPTNNIILHTYKSPIVVDPNDPQLPSTHKLSMLKGTVWRSDDVFLKTNNNGIIYEQRVFMFFDRERNAISYRYVRVNDKHTPVWPEDAFFIPLIPILQTNDFVPIPSVEVEGKLPGYREIQKEVDLLLMRNYRYEEALEKLMSRYGVTTNVIAQVITNITPVYIQDTQKEDVPDEAVPEDEYDEYGYDDEYGDEYDEYDDYYYSRGMSEYISTRLLGQNIIELPESQYLINIGGTYGGAFIHKTGDSRYPYKVIFLQLDPSGMYLYEYNYDYVLPINQQQILEFFTKIVNEKTQMKRFQRVRYDREFLY